MINYYIDIIIEKLILNMASTFLPNFYKSTTSNLSYSDDRIEKLSFEENTFKVLSHD